MIQSSKRKWKPQLAHSTPLRNSRGGTILRLSIVLFWVVVMGVFVAREARKASLGPFAAQLATDDLAGDVAWYGIYFLEGEGDDEKRVKIGYSHTERTSTSGGYMLHEQSRLKLVVQGQEKTIRSKIRAAVDKEYHLQSIDYELNSDLMKFRISGRVKADNVLQLNIDAGGGIRTEKIPLDGDATIPLNMAQRIAASGLQVGKTYQYPYFDPSSMSMDTLSSTVLGIESIQFADSERKVFLVESKFKGLPIRSWIDEEGNLIKELAASMMSVRETREYALSRGWGEGVPMDIIDMAAIKVDRKIEKPRGIKSMKVRLSGADLEGLPLYDERQKPGAEGEIVISLEDAEKPAGYEMPYLAKAHAEFLKPSATLQSDDPDIIAQAREIAGEQTDPLLASRALFEWVYKTLDKEPVVSVPSAKAVLDIKRGDCNEHAALLAALARSVGIPSKILVGVVYNDGSFYYHAWNALWVGRWIAMDATFGQFPADATHIKFLEGDLDEQVAVARLIGKLNIEVIEAR